LSSPLQVGIYQDNKLIKNFTTKEQTSEALPKIFENILKEFTCKRVFFARGPGSFMAIKITYIFLRTLSIVKDIELFATDGFYFNDNKPIRAMKNMYFTKENEEIKTEFFNEEQNHQFILPKVIEIENFSKDIEPLYILPAV
jgi:tRNA A37 threonylcarbamoyladenosine modification protein TsaB